MVAKGTRVDTTAIPGENVDNKVAGTSSEKNTFFSIQSMAWENKNIVILWPKNIIMKIKITNEK